MSVKAQHRISTVDNGPIAVEPGAQKNDAPTADALIEQSVGENSKEMSHLTEPWKHSRLHQLFSPQALENMFQKPLGLYTDSSMPDPQQFHTCPDPSSFLGDGESFMIETCGEDVLPQSFTIADMDDIFAGAEQNNRLVEISRAEESNSQRKVSFLRDGPSPVSLTSPPATHLPRESSLTVATNDEHSFLASMQSSRGFDVSVLVENDDGPVENNFSINNNRSSQSRSYSIMTAQDDDSLRQGEKNENFDEQKPASVSSENPIQPPIPAALDKTTESTNGSAGPSYSFHIPANLIVESTNPLKDFTRQSAAVIDDDRSGKPSDTALRFADKIVAEPISTESKEAQPALSPKSTPDVSIRKELQRIRADHPNVFEFASPAPGGNANGESFVSKFSDYRIELNLHTISDSLTPKRTNVSQRFKQTPRFPFGKSTSKSSPEAGSFETILRAEHEFSPNKVQLFQVNYDMKKMPALAAELREADYGSVSHIEDDLGVNVSIKRLKLSEKSFQSQVGGIVVSDAEEAALNIEADPGEQDSASSSVHASPAGNFGPSLCEPPESDLFIGKSFERNSAEKSVICGREALTADANASKDARKALPRMLALINDVCSVDHSNSNELTATDISKDMAPTQIIDLSSNEHSDQPFKSGASFRERKSESCDKSALIEVAVESIQSPEPENLLATEEVDSCEKEAIEVERMIGDISRVSLRTEDQTSISHCSSPSFLSNFDVDASVINHTSFIRSKLEYSRKNIAKSTRPCGGKTTAINSALLANDATEEEATRNANFSPDANLSFEVESQTSTSAIDQVTSQTQDNTVNTAADTTRFAALERAFDELLDVAEGPSMILRKEVSLYIQSQIIDDENNILNIDDPANQTLEAKRLIRESLDCSELTSKCTTLDISGKNIDSIYGLVDLCPSLKFLKVDNNSIYFLAGAPITLTFMSVRNNNLNDMTIFEHLPNLHHLDISFNKLISLQSLSSLKHLRELVVDGNLLESMRGIEACTGLVKISVTNNRIKFSEPEVWSGVNQLEWLDITGNCLIDLNGIERCTNLLVLRAGDNKINRLGIIDGMPKLQQLWLNGNQLRDFESHLFPALSVLNLDFNPLSIDIFSAERQHRLASIKELGLRKLISTDNVLDIEFRKFHDCTFIALSGNFLRSLTPLMGYYCLEYLDVSGCHLRFLPGNLVSGMPNLRVLDLSHNSLSSIAPLRKLKRLRRLYLLDNDLKSVSECLTALTGLRKLQVLDLRQNPITANFYPSTSSIGIYFFKRPSVDSPAEWAASVDRFLLELNDAAFVRRLCYKSTAIHKLSNTLHTFDGLLITEKERMVAEEQYQKLKNNFSGYYSYQTSPVSSRQFPLYSSHGPIRRNMNYNSFPALQFAHTKNQSGGARNNSGNIVASNSPLFAAPPFPRQDSDSTANNVNSRRSPLISRRHPHSSAAVSASSLASNATTSTHFRWAKCENEPRRYGGDFVPGAKDEASLGKTTVKPSVSFWIPVEKQSKSTTTRNTAGSFAPASSWQQQQQQQQRDFAARNSAKNPAPIIKPVRPRNGPLSGVTNSAATMPPGRRRYCVFADNGKPLLLTRDMDPSSRGVWG